MNSMLDDVGGFRKRLLLWFRRHGRKLPWRKSPGSLIAPDPYLILVSEAMLQQTQVATVMPYFRRFIARFPRLSDLAAAPEREVLRLWQGLGYYRRAAHLHATAKIVQKKYHGQLPSSVAQLLSLPGVGRYTAGAIASIAFNRPAPILDGNVRRVLCRVLRVTSDPRSRATQQRLWKAAAELVAPRRPGDFNSALMDLGAIVCTPRRPRCHQCPVRCHCRAYARGDQDELPRKEGRGTTKPLHRRWTICIQRGNGWLIEQRPANGRWASLWQFVTIPAEAGEPSGQLLSDRLGIRIARLRRLASIRHELSHRRYEFEVFVASTSNARCPKRRWVTLKRLTDYPLPRPHARVAELLE